jgi:hypothetical protein
MYDWTSAGWVGESGERLGDRDIDTGLHFYLHCYPSSDMDGREYIQEAEGQKAGENEAAE